LDLCKRKRSAVSCGYDHAVLGSYGGAEKDEEELMPRWAPLASPRSISARGEPPC